MEDLITKLSLLSSVSVKLLSIDPEAGTARLMITTKRMPKSKKDLLERTSLELKINDESRTDVLASVTAPPQFHPEINMAYAITTKRN